MRPSLMVQYFAPIPSTCKVRIYLTRERYTNPPETMRLSYHILPDLLLIKSYDKHIFTTLSLCYDLVIRLSAKNLRSCYSKTTVKSNKLFCLLKVRNT